MWTLRAIFEAFAAMLYPRGDPTGDTRRGNGSAAGIGDGMARSLAFTELGKRPLGFR
jgi:hypothetical protein